MGSLYEYFPGKEALVAALVERHLEDAEARLDRLAHSLAGADLRIESLVVSIVEATVSGSAIGCAPVAGTSSRSTPVEPVTEIAVVVATEKVPSDTLLVLRTV